MATDLDQLICVMGSWPCSLMESYSDDRASELPGFMEMSDARFMRRTPHWGATAGFFTLHVVPRRWLHLWTLVASQDIGGSIYKWSEASLCHCHWTVWWKALLIFNNPKCKSKPNRWTFHPKTSEVLPFFLLLLSLFSGYLHTDSCWWKILLFTSLLIFRF